MILSKALCFLFLPLVYVPISGDVLMDDNPSEGKVCGIANSFTVSDDLYDLELRVEQTDAKVYYLVATLDFHNDSYAASPLSNNDFTGLFTLDVADFPYIQLDDAIEETPRSVETTDRGNNTPVNWLREKTTYRRILHINANEDFDAGGKATFTIEPRCTFENIPFMIKNRGGVLSIEKWEC